MKRKFWKISMAFFLLMICFQNLLAQNIIITDTVKLDQLVKGFKSDSLFTVDGEVIGMDSGTMQISSPDKTLLVSIPFRQGKFYFSGFVKSLQPLRISIRGDYYESGFYAEPGKIKIEYIYHGLCKASGTIENDLSTYFRDTLNRSNSERFSELSNELDIALKNNDLKLYLNLIDSFTIAENNFFKVVNVAIDQKKIGYYLLGCVNYFYVNYGYFAERKSIYDQLPDQIKNSVLGKQALASLESTKKKNTAIINELAFEFILNDNSDKSVSLKKFQGKIIVLDFWASWCIPCLKALPLLTKIQASDVSKNVSYISISIDKKPEDWKAMEKKIKLPWISLLADTSTIKHYQVDAVPNYIVINEEGRIVSKSSSLGDLYKRLEELKK